VALRMHQVIGGVAFLAASERITMAQNQWNAPASWLTGIVVVRFAAVLPLLFLAGLLGLAILPDGAAQQTSETADKPISVDVNLVEVRATVTDHGHPVSGLTQENFEVFEDGVAQPIRIFAHEDTPVVAGLVVDHSGSMRPKLSEVSSAAKTFVAASNPEDRMFVVNFNDSVTIGLPKGISFTGSPTVLEQAVSGTPPEGRTALYDGIVQALDLLKMGTLENKVLIVVSDGGDNASRHTLAQVLKLAEQSSAVIYTVGVFDDDDPDANRRVLRTLANSTGGISFFSDDLGQLVNFCAKIARDIRSQYTIAYAPLKPSKPGEYRTIRLNAKAPRHGKLSVRARTGYIVSGASHEPDPNTLKSSR
jgi:Ca-activated chloride channel family protein